MRLESLVCTRQQSEQLKALGIEQASIACYIGDELHLFEKHLYDWAEQKNISAVAAYTVSELGIMLPTETYDCNRSGGGIFASEAEARADLLIHLLENNLTTAEEVNQRLQA